jgi:CRISPR-associated protein (TIGR03984 family)
MVKKMPDEYNADIKIEKGKRLVEQGEFAATNYASVEKLCNDKKISNNSYVVAWFNNIVKWGKYVQGKLIWVDEKTPEYKQLVEMRIFNRKEELYINNMLYRYICDCPLDNLGENIEYVDYSSRFWGEKKSVDEKGTVLLDKERQIELKIPYIGTTKYSELVIRSYIAYNQQTGQAGYEMYRYLDIKEGR